MMVNVYETVNYYSMGIFSAEEAVERLRAWKLYDQVAFCTERALSYTLFRYFGTIKGIIWKVIALACC
jgi:hypothetical protein